MQTTTIDGSESLTELLRALAHALSTDTNVSDDTRERAEWLLKCLDTMGETDVLIAVQH